VIGIYKITNLINKKVYIGQTTDIDYRWDDYERLRCKRQKKLYNSFKFYGLENHSFEIIEECSVEMLNQRERYWQDFYDVLNRKKGLNLRLTKTDDKSGKTSDETKRKISKNHASKKEGYISPRKGLKHTEETKEKIRISQTGKKHNEISCKKMSESRSGNKNHNYGKITSDEVKKKISDGNKGKIITQEARNKMSEKRKGNKNALGYKHTDETKKKMSSNNSKYSSKMVIDLENGFVYNSGKEAWDYNKDYIMVGYSNFRGKLNGSLKNNTKFQYI
jgi:group I intron endonuclease